MNHSRHAAPPPSSSSWLPTTSSSAPQPTSTPSPVVPVSVPVSTITSAPVSDPAIAAAPQDATTALAAYANANSASAQTASVTDPRHGQKLSQRQAQVNSMNTFGNLLNGNHASNNANNQQALLQPQFQSHAGATIGASLGMSHGLMQQQLQGIHQPQSQQQQQEQQLLNLQQLHQQEQSFQQQSQRIDAQQAQQQRMHQIKLQNKLQRDELERQQRQQQRQQQHISQQGTPNAPQYPYAPAPVSAQQYSQGLSLAPDQQQQPALLQRQEEAQRRQYVTGDIFSRQSTQPQQNLFSMRPQSMPSQHQQIQLQQQHQQQPHQHQQQQQRVSHRYSMPSSSQQQFPQGEHLSSDKYQAFNIPHLQGEGPPQLRGVPPLPSAKALQQSSGMRGMETLSLRRGPVKSMGSDPHTRTRLVSSNKLRSMRAGASSTQGQGGELIRDTVQAFLSSDVSASTERNDFISTYAELMSAYEEKCEAIYDAADAACVTLILNSRVPFMEDTITAPVDDETAEDARQKLIVKKKFVEAMERLQGDQLPTKRRGNLPKESTAYLKKWFDDHYDHPYPSDAEKLAMSKAARIGITQISHWFINHRKRVWKPSLPPSHPVHSGDHSNKKRKKSRKDLPVVR